MGVQSAIIKKRKIVFQVVFFGYRHLFSIKSLIWMVQKKLSKGLLRNAVKKYTSEKKIHEEFLSWNVFFWLTLLSVGAQRSEEGKEKHI